MTVTAASFAVAANDAAGLIPALNEVARAVSRPTAGLVFLSGGLTQDVTPIARAVARTWPGIPTLIATGAGVMNERSTFEAQSAGAGLLLAGPRAASVAVSGTPDDLGKLLADALREATGGRPATVTLFASPEGWSPGALEEVSVACPNVRLLGGGTLSEPPPLVIDASGAMRTGTAAGLVFPFSPAVVGVSPACRTLGQGPVEVTEARGAVVLSLGGEPALDVLSRAAEGLEGRPLVLALYPSADDPTGRRGARVRPIRGVDPGRKAVVVGEPVRAGDRLGFAVLDGTAARLDLEATLRDVGRRAAGSATRFGLYVGCSGRGAHLYGSSGVDARLVRTQFPGLPFAGVMSSFELGSVDGAATMHLYTGVMGLFTAPS